MNWIQILGPSLLIILGGIITWIIKSKIEELRSIEEKLLEERRKIYINILEPFILIFAGVTPGKIKEAQNIISSDEYRKTGFLLNLYGSDNVIKAFNDMMILAFSSEKTESRDPLAMMNKLGKFLLEIRKSVGNKKSKLKNIDMLRSMLKDLDSHTK